MKQLEKNVAYKLSICRLSVQYMIEKGKQVLPEEINT